MVEALDRAREFLERNGRLLERHRFAHLFDGAPAAPMLEALSAYQNPDGGYGHALEPDLRGPVSQPVPVWTALWLLDEARGLNRKSSRRALEYLAQVEVKGGGVPFVFRSASDYPHAPWWEVGRGPVRASLNPTAGIAAAFHKNGISSPWLDRATQWCWRRIGQLREVQPYELRVTLSFLDHVPDRERAHRTLERLRPMVRRKGVVELDPAVEGEVFRPLDFAPEPGTLSRSLFTEEEVARELEAIERRQADDGGWRVPYLIWTPLTEFEWRGVQTVEMLKVLWRNGRLTPPRGSR